MNDAKQTVPTIPRMGGYRAAREVTGFPMSTLYALVNQRRIPHIRYGPRHVMFDLDELKQWVDQHRVRAGGNAK